MKIKNLIGGASLALLGLTVLSQVPSVSARAQGPEAIPLSVYVYPVLLPPTSSSGFNTAASAQIDMLYSTGAPSGLLGHTLQSDYVSQGGSDSTLWFIVDVRGRDQGVTFQPMTLQFIGSSSDNGNVLGKTNSFDATYVMNATARGILYNSAGPSVNDTIVTQGSWSQPVNRFMFIGASSKAFGYSGGNKTPIVNYLNSFTNYLVTGEWSVMSGTNSVRAFVTLQTTGQPVCPLLDIRPAQPCWVAVGADISTNQTIVLQYMPTFRTTPFVIGTFSAGDMPYRGLAVTPSGFFRAYIE